MDQVNDQSIPQPIPQQEPSVPQHDTLSLKKIIFIILGIIVLAGLTGGAYLLGTKHTNSPSSVKERITYISPTPIITTTPTQSPQTILQSLQNTISATAPITQRKSVDWYDGTSQIIPLSGWAFTLGTFTNDYMGGYGKFSGLSDITTNSLHPLQSAVENFFVKNNFAVSQVNNKTLPTMVTYGYVLGDMKCLVTLYPESNPFGSFFCGSLSQEELAWRKELVPIINATNDPGLRVSVDKLIGNYATGYVGGGEGGVIWYAVKVDGQWKEVWTGQNAISCKPVQQYAIPKEIYGDGCSNNY